MSGQYAANFRFVRVGLVREERIERHQNARRAEPALQGVMPPEGGLQDAEASIPVGQAFYRPYLASLDLKGKSEAGARRLTVDVHGAGAADAMLTADMGPGCADLVADEVGQQHPRLAEAVYRFAVEQEVKTVVLFGAHARHPVTSMISSRPIIRTRSRR
jgi:hypothetical protein